MTEEGKKVEDREEDVKEPEVRREDSDGEKQVFSEGVKEKESGEISGDEGNDVSGVDVEERSKEESKAEAKEEESKVEERKEEPADTEKEDVSREGERKEETGRPVLKEESRSVSTVSFSAQHVIIGVLAVIFILGGVWFLGNPSGGGGVVPNDSAITGGIVSTGGAIGIVDNGDRISVRYTGRYENGTIFDTNDPGNKEEYDRPISDQPLQFTVGGGSVIAGFNEGVVGMKVGETKEISIPKEKGYPYDEKAVVTINRSLSIERTIVVPRSQQVTESEFSQMFSQNASEGLIVGLDQIPYNFTVTGITDGKVTVRADPEVNQVVYVPRTNWNSTIVSVDDDTLTVRQDPEDGQIVSTPLGEAVISVDDVFLTIESRADVGDVVRTEFGQAVVIESNNDTLVLDANHPLAGLPLEFTVTVISIDQDN